MGLSPMHLFIGPAKGADPSLHGTHQLKGNAMLLLPSMNANRTTLADGRQQTIQPCHSILVHSFPQ
jgi:hypothetical protein